MQLQRPSKRLVLPHSSSYNVNVTDCHVSVTENIPDLATVLPNLESVQNAKARPLPESEFQGEYNGDVHPVHRPSPNKAIQNTKKSQQNIILYYNIYVGQSSFLQVPAPD
jgi:hypothetical protein